MTSEIVDTLKTTSTIVTDVFLVSLSGGSAPRVPYALLASDAFRGRFSWEPVYQYWGDEHFLPHDHPLSKENVIFQAIRTGDSDASAARVRPIGELIWFVDRTAAREN